ncbi:hypothetical protein BP5796_06929 [Coleophoma crateriformis]|uniref:Uncharacterized protein n=1 Tax=Coleophoma crateriformis TaxID=565419 RepID=A0A3D8RQ83_9HELO|nr:hypothetical protein BP5796_06929 [Coleophoma crateriformis]
MADRICTSTQSNYSLARLSIDARSNGTGEIKPDFDKILIEGDSAVQSAISQAGKAKAMIAAYPPIDLKIPFFTSAYERSMVGFPMMPSDIVSKHKVTLTKDSICTAASPPDRLDLAFGAIQNGQYVALLGLDPSLFPMERIESASDLPAMFIMHGKDDSAVPYMSGPNTFTMHGEIMCLLSTNFLTIYSTPPLFNIRYTIHTPHTSDTIHTSYTSIAHSKHGYTSLYFSITTSASPCILASATVRAPVTVRARLTTSARATA